MLELIILMFFGASLFLSTGGDADDSSGENQAGSGGGSDQNDGNSAQGNGDLVLGEEATNDDPQAQDDQNQSEGDAPPPATSEDTQPDDDGGEDETPFTPDFSVTENDDGGLHFELGEDDPGSIVALKVFATNITGSSGDRTADIDLQFYYLPEGEAVENPDTVEQFGEGVLPDLVAEANMTLIATLGLGAVDGAYDDDTGRLTETDGRVEPPEITANTDITIYRVEASTLDYHQYIDVVQIDETYSPFEEITLLYNGSEAIVAGSGTINGTPQDDWILANSDEADGGILFGLGGDDLIAVRASDVTAYGGDGEDRMQGDTQEEYFNSGAQLPTDNVTFYGGNGDDDILVLGDSEGHGDAGNDSVTVISEDTFNPTGYGGAGNDLISVRGDGATGFGNGGDDQLSARDCGAAHGGFGNDVLNISRDSSGFGGAGDDFLSTTGHFPDDAAEAAAVLTGGEGADTFRGYVRGWDEGETRDLMQITDFNPSEDIMKVERWSNDYEFGEIDIQEAADGSNTLVTVEVLPAEGNTFATGSTYVTIQLDGVTGFTADMVELG